MSKRTLTETQRRGLFHGQHNVHSGRGLEQLQNEKERRLVALARTLNARLVQLRAAIAKTGRLAAQARRNFQIFDAEAGGEVPPLFWPVLGVVLSVAFSVGDAFMMAPLLQGIGIVDLLEQWALALLIGGGLTAFVHMAFRLWQQNRKICSVAVLTVTALTVVSVCWWRCDQIVYAASLVNGAWRDFLSEHPQSTRLFVVGFGLILPIAAGYCSAHALPTLQFSTRWHWARYCAARRESERDLLVERLNASVSETKLAIRDIESPVLNRARRIPHPSPSGYRATTIWYRGFLA